MAAVTDEEAGHPAAVRQPRHPDVEIHPVDALHLDSHMIIEDVGDATRYGHHKLRSGRAASRPTNRYRRFIYRIGSPVTV
jgi:hypothetical protein